MEEKEVDESLREAIYGDTYIELVAKLYSGEIQNGLTLLLIFLFAALCHKRCNLISFEIFKYSSVELLR